MSEEKVVMTWSDLGQASLQLAKNIHASGYHPDIILCVARGGMVPGAALGYALGVKNIWSVNVEFYVGVNERLPMPIVLPPVPNWQEMSGLKILVVDDVADTGETLVTINSLCQGIPNQIKYAVMYEKPWNTFPVEYVWRRTEDWIVFPWAGDEYANG